MTRTTAAGSSAFCDYLIEVGAVQGLDGWAQVGGTSLSSPLIASVYALAGNTASVVYGSYPVQPHELAVRRDQRLERQLLAARTCAPPARATTARPVWARPNGTGAF